MGSDDGQDGFRAILVIFVILVIPIVIEIIGVIVESIAAEIIAIEISTVKIVIKAIVSSIIAVEFNVIVADQPVVTVISQGSRHVIMRGNAPAVPIADSALPCYREAFRIVILSRMRHDIAPLSQR